MVRKSNKLNVTLGCRPTENKNIFVDALPEFARANKYIGNYNVYVQNNEVPDGTLIEIKAYSTKTGWGELKNNISRVVNDKACFEDLRFIGKSGRGIS